MDMDEQGILARFQSLLEEIQATFTAMREKFPDEVCCKPGCVDCCHACFDVSLMEKVYIQQGLEKLRDDQTAVAEIMQGAMQAKNEIERYVAASDEQGGSIVYEGISRWRVKCPMLLDGQTCAIYEFRPVTCRVYGLPTSIGGHGHVCGFSGFDKGKTYPTIKLDAIAGYLLELSKQLATAKKNAADRAGNRFFLHAIVLEPEEFG